MHPGRADPHSLSFPFLFLERHFAESGASRPGHHLKSGGCCRTTAKSGGSHLCTGGDGETRDLLLVGEPRWLRSLLLCCGCRLRLLWSLFVVLLLRWCFGVGVGVVVALFVFDFVVVVGGCLAGAHFADFNSCLPFARDGVS